jgi:hypothetical protein
LVPGGPLADFRHLGDLGRLQTLFAFVFGVCLDPCLQNLKTLERTPEDIKCKLIKIEDYFWALGLNMFEHGPGSGLVV